MLVQLQQQQLLLLVKRKIINSPLGHFFFLQFLFLVLVRLQVSGGTCTQERISPHREETQTKHRDGGGLKRNLLQGKNKSTEQPKKLNEKFTSALRTRTRTGNLQLRLGVTPDGGPCSGPLTTEPSSTAATERMTISSPVRTSFGSVLVPPLSLSRSVSVWPVYSLRRRRRTRSTSSHRVRVCAPPGRITHPPPVDCVRRGRKERTSERTRTWEWEEDGNGN